MSPLLELPHQLDHGFDVLGVGRAGVMLGPLDVQRGAVLEKVVDELLGVLAKVHSRRPGAVDGLVVDVGEVRHLGDAVALVLQVAAEDVLRDEGAEVSDVAPVVDREPAGVHAHVVVFERLEGLELSAEGVGEPEFRHA